MKTNITSGERLQLIGLLALAERYDRAMADIKDSALQLLGIEAADDRLLNNPADHVADAIWSDDDRDVDGLLTRLGIVVLPPAPPPPPPPSES